jgi:hypothetical protein
MAPSDYSEETKLPADKTNEMEGVFFNRKRTCQAFPENALIVSPLFQKGLHAKDSAPYSQPFSTNRRDGRMQAMCPVPKRGVPFKICFIEHA